MTSLHLCWISMGSLITISLSAGWSLSSAQALSGSMALLLLIGLLLQASLVFFIFKSHTDQKEILKNLDNLIDGFYDGEYSFNATGILKHIGIKLNTIRESLIEVSRQAKNIAAGDHLAKISPRSEKDQLGVALFEMTQTLRSITTVCDAVIDNDFSLRIQEKGKDDLLSQRLNTMISTMGEHVTSITKDSWMHNAQAELATALRGELDVEEVAKKALSYIAQKCSAQCGTLYVVKEGSLAQLKATYALSDPQKQFQEFKEDEGLIGQSIRNRTFLRFSPVSSNKANQNNGYPIIVSSTIKIVPKDVLVFPLMQEGLHVKAVIELCSSDELSPETITLLQAAQESIVIAIQGAQSRMQMVDMLEDTQRQAEEIQAQNEEMQASQEELRQTNEELEEQSQALRRSEEELISQQEELQVTNEELKEKSRSMETQALTVTQKNKELQDFSTELQAKADLLSQASRYKSEFLANMSHELRTPLNSLLLLSKLMKDNTDEDLSPDHVESASYIYQAGVDLLELINDILDLSKIEAGKVIVSIQKVNCDTIVQNMSNTFTPVAKDKNIIYKDTISQDLPPLHTDHQRLTQILKNFLSNAFKFSQEGTILFEVYRAEDHEHIHFRVTDEGIGIPQDKLNDVFEAFQQVDGSISRHYGGTGLGLSISRELATLLQGEISVSSELGKGSVFTLSLPLQYEAIKSETLPSAESIDPVVHESNSLPPASQQLSEIDIDRRQLPSPFLPDGRDDIQKEEAFVLLVIEDDSIFATQVRDQAQKMGFKVLLTSHGESGILVAEELLPSAIILDLGLPSMDGKQVLALLKKNAKTRHIPVQVVSSQDKDIETLQMGAIDFSIKPLDSEALDHMLSAIKSKVGKKAKRLLIVEDDHILRKTMTEMIGNKDIEVTLADTGQSVLENLKTGRFDCMVLDLRLPDMTGFEVLERIDQDETIGPMPIIIYTDKDLDHREEAELSQYAKSIIIKGVNSMERLLDQVVLFLHRAQNILPNEKQKILNLLRGNETTMQGKKILVVDDDMRNTFALSKILKKAGMEVILAENGQKAISTLEQHPDTNLVLMDIMMPIMDGLTATAKIRTMDQFKDLPILALTAQAMTGDRERCIEAGANDYLAKPVDIEKLMSMLRVWLYGR